MTHTEENNERSRCYALGAAIGDLLARNPELDLSRASIDLHIHMTDGDVERDRLRVQVFAERWGLDQRPQTRPGRSSYTVTTLNARISDEQTLTVNVYGPGPTFVAVE